MRLPLYLAHTVLKGAACALLLSTPLLAQSTHSLSPLVMSCANCHGPEGRSAMPEFIPSLAGQDASKLLAQLRSYQSTPPPANTTVMNRLVGGFSDEELKALAHYFSSLPATPQKVQP